MTTTFLYSTTPAPHEDHMLQLAQRSRQVQSQPVRIVALLTALSNPAESELVMLRSHFCNGKVAASLDDSGLQTRADAYDPEVISRIQDADLVVIGGGDPIRLYEHTRDTPALAALRASHQRGAVIAACSAGAAAIGAGMITGTADARQPARLWAWFSDLLIAPHFGSYDHTTWLDQFPGHTMLGIPDHAMALITNGRLETLSQQPLTIIRPGHQPQQLAPGQTGAIDLQA